MNKFRYLIAGSIMLYDIIGSSALFRQMEERPSLRNAIPSERLAASAQ